MKTFQVKNDVDNFIRSLSKDAGLIALPKLYKKVVDVVAREDAELFDTICEKIENAKTSCQKYPEGFVSTIWGPGFQISYEASRVPKAYAFTLILKTMLPE